VLFTVCWRSCLVSYALVSTDAECVSRVCFVGEEAYCRQLRDPAPSPVMAPRGYRDITVENGQVWEVHVIDHNHYVEVYDIAEWKALILAVRNPPV
jgi:hypothetical protein